jgi:hypothetical protein
MIGTTYSVLAAFTDSAQSLTRFLSPSTLYPPSVLPPPVGASRFHSGSPSPVFQRARSRVPFGTVRRKKPFNTQRCVPAPFNEFYRKLPRSRFVSVAVWPRNQIGQHSQTKRRLLSKLFEN